MDIGEHLTQIPGFRPHLPGHPASMIEAPVQAETPAKSEAPARRSIWDTVKSFFG